jgi:hypothetical protein
MFRPAAWTPDPGKSAAGIAAVKIFFDDILDDRPEITIVPLEPALVFGDEPLEMMEKHPVENGAFRMTRAVKRKPASSPPSSGRSKKAGRSRLKVFRSSPRRP